MASPAFEFPVNDQPQQAPRKRTTGRPTWLRGGIQSSIVEYVRQGASFKAACRASGIPLGTGKEWLARGRGTHAGGRSAAPVYAAFAVAIEEARNPTAAKPVNRIGGDWKLLKTTVKTTRGKDGQPKVIETSEMEKRVLPEGRPLCDTSHKLVRVIIKCWFGKNGEPEKTETTVIEQDVPTSGWAALRFLERRWPEKWSPTYRLRHSGQTSLELTS